MNENQSALWRKLEGFQVGSGDDALSFTGRLARDNGWTLPFAARVFNEYKRFLYLCSEAGHPCTPSEHVDEAWHLHMVYTRSYWGELCDSVLERPLHHDPTVGGAAEAGKFVDWYERTLTSYREVFGSEPPPDIWPPASERFAVGRVRKIDTALHYIVPKERVRRAVMGVVLVSLLVIAAGCARDETSRTLIGIAVFLALALLVFLFVMLMRGRKWDSSSGCAAGCSTSSSGCGSSGCGSGCGGGGCGGGCGS